MNWKQFISQYIVRHGRLNKNYSRSDKFSPVREFLQNKPGRTLIEKLYLYYYNLKKIPQCECGELLTLISFSEGYHSFCSNKCGRKSETTKAKYHQTCLKKYGVNSTNKVPVIKQKKRETWNKLSEEEKLQSVSPMRKARKEQNKTITQKIKQTKKERYGDENYNNSEKYQETMMERYGIAAPIQIKEIKDKVILKAKSTLKKTQFEKLQKLNLVKPLFTIDDYISIHYSHKYLWKCKKCGEEFKDDLYAGRLPRCPVCFPKHGPISHLENELISWFQELNIQFIKNNRKIIKPQELDIYLLKYKLAIEFNGLYWHSELQGKDKNYHLNKTIKCKEKGIQLIHIYEDEWIEKQEIVKSIIKSKLGIYNEKIYARNCEVREIKNNDFYDQNHVQGGIKSKINLGLFYKNELVSMLSFSKPRFNKKHDWEIIRFANKLNTKVVGSFAKLLAHFNHPGSIITYSDKRYFDGNIYLKNGFTQLKDTPPNYYYTDYKNRYSRLKFQKHKIPNADQNLTEWQNMQLQGWDRIWDCGNYCFSLLKNSTVQND